MCRTCRLAEEESGFSLAECPEYLAYEEQRFIEDRWIAIQDDIEACGPRFYIHNEEIPF